MKKITTIMAGMFAVVMALSSCTSDENPVSTNPLVSQLAGEWIIEIPVSDLEYTEDNGDIEIPSGADTFTIIYHFFNDGTVWKEIDIMKNGECIFQPVSRYDFDPYHYTIDSKGEVVVTFPDGESSDILHFDGETLILDDVDLQLPLERASEEQIRKYASESDKIHGGNDEDKTVDTGISDTDADDIARTNRR